MASDEDIDKLLDAVREDQLEVASRLAKLAQEKKAFDDFKHELVMLALTLGKEAAQDALPFLMAALKVAIVAA